MVAASALSVTDELKVGVIVMALAVATERLRAAIAHSVALATREPALTAFLLAEKHIRYPLQGMRKSASQS